MTIEKLIEIENNGTSFKLQGVADALTMSVKFQVCHDELVVFEATTYDEARSYFDEIYEKSLNKEGMH